MEQQAAPVYLLIGTKTLATIIADRTGKSLEEIYKVTQYDSFYTAEEAVEFGLAHKIINKLI